MKERHVKDSDLWENWGAKNYSRDPDYHISHRNFSELYMKSDGE